MRLTLNDLNYIINESYNRLMLLEISNNAIETLFKKYCDDIVVKHFDSTLEYIYDNNIRNINITLADVQSHPNMKLKDYLRLKLMDAFGINRGRGPIKWFRGIIRICFDWTMNPIYFFSKLENKDNLKKFKRIIEYIYTNNLDFDEDLNGLAFGQLYRVVGTKMRIEAYQKWLANKKENSQNVFGEYTVIPINNYEEAAQYSKYTSWCVTHGTNAFNTYTGDGSQFFFCLKNGFEDVVEKQGTNCPLDEYGLSMVSVLVSPDYTAKHVTTRWNHNNNGEDNPNLETLEQVEQVLGIPKNTFTDNLVPEIEYFDMQGLIDNGIDINNIVRTEKEMGSTKIISHRSSNIVLYNAMKDGKLLSKDWYKTIRRYTDFTSLSRTSINGTMYNYFDEKGKIFPNDIKYTVRGAFDENHDIFKVGNSKGEINLMKRGSTELLLSENVLYISKLIYGYAAVENAKGQTNMLKEDFTFLFPKFLDANASYFHVNSNEAREIKVWTEDMLILRSFNGTEETYLNLKTGKVITDQWFKECFNFKNGLGRVHNENNEINMIKTDGTLISEKWFRCINEINGGYFRGIILGEKGETILDPQGNMPINKHWYYVTYYNGKYGIVSPDHDHDQLIDSDGNVIFTTTDMLHNIYGNKIVLAEDNNDYKYFMDINGNILTPKLQLIKVQQQPDEKIYRLFKDVTSEQQYRVNKKTGDIEKV